MNTAYILTSYRTPGCRSYSGKFKNLRPDDLAAQTIKGIVEHSTIDPATIDDVYLGCSFPEAEQGLNLGRLAAMKAGLPIDVPGLVVNRFCSSGLQTISMAAERVMAGGADCILAGGVESMTYVPMGGQKYAPHPAMVADWPESYAAMGITAEIVSEKFGISRQMMDEFAVQSHRKAAAAVAEGKFEEEILPIEIERTTLLNGKVLKENELVKADEGIRLDTSTESLARLRPVFKANGLITAGNACQVTDGAALTAVVSENYLRRMNREPLARYIGFAVKGVAPEIMGIGPVAAVPAVLKQTNMDIDDIDLIELNEAFAGQVLSCVKELGLDQGILNVNGGAIALGHPLGCTGAKLTTTLLHELARRKGGYGMVTMCIGGGMGAAGIFENLQRT